jgi:uncharacterized protein DUF2855
VTDFLIEKANLRETRIAASDEVPEIGDGQALLRVDTFGLTANNVTYAAFGEAMSYWNFFPAGEEGWGRMPVWGFAEVAESKHPDIEAGGRVYGYLPPSNHLVVEPAGADERGFLDGSAHRRPLPSAYQRYLLSATDPFYTAESEAVQMLLRPLFFTSFLLADDMLDGGLAGARTAVMSAASSKTAIGTAFQLAQEGADDLQTVGLTSERSREFTESLDIYDRVVTYDDLESIDPADSAYVDFSGDGKLRGAVHRRLEAGMVASIAVGATSWDELAAREGERPGPAPRFFFAPDRVTKRNQDWGRAGLEQRVADAWQPFARWVEGWMDVEPSEGFESVQRIYGELLDNAVPPKTAYVVSL